MGVGAAPGLSKALDSATTDELKDAVNSLSDGERAKVKAVLESIGKKKIIKAETYFHPAVAFGAAKPDWFAKVDALAKDYCSALTSLPNTDAVLANFADGATWTDPVGGEDPPYVGTAGIKELLGKIPKVLSSEFKEVFYTPSPKIFLVKYDVVMQGETKGQSFLIDILEVNDDMKIVKAETHFHPSMAFGAPRQDWMDGIDAFAKGYCSALTSLPNTDAVLANFADGATWTDPVGGEDPPYVGTAGIKELLGKIPKVLSSEFKEVFYTPSPKIFLVKYDVVMQGEAKGQSILVDRIELA